MASEAAFLCVFALLAQSIAGQPCYQSRPSSICGCGSDSVSISVSEQSCYQPITRPVSLPRPTTCGCNSDSVSITVSEGTQSVYRPRPAPCSSNRVSVGVSGSSSGYQSAISSPCVSIAVPDNGGAFAVTSIGPIAPSGIAVATDLGLAGDLYLAGELPYLSAVAFEGQFETSGATPVSYGCGNGCVAITEQIGGNVNYGNAGGSVNVNVAGGGYGCGCY